VNKIIRTFTTLFALVVAHGAALADPVEEKNLLSGKDKLDPAQGYIFVQASTRIFGTFLHVPDDATKAEYQKDWEEAFAKAQKKYPGALRSWETDALIARQSKAKPPERPVEPTRDNFTIDSIELRDTVSFGPMFIFNKGIDRFAYLQAVKPGTYIYYGPVLMTPGAPGMGICNCMGTVQFEVKAGIITDLGNSLVALSKPEPPFDVGTQEAIRRAREKAAKDGNAIPDGPITNLNPLAYGLPESLKSWPSAQAEFWASGKLNNYYGLLITRMQPIPGILGYRRDTVIDLRTNTEIVSPTIYTQARIKK
jgi:hypothetical protein